VHQDRWSGGSRAGGVCIRADGRVVVEQVVCASGQMAGW